MNKLFLSIPRTEINNYYLVRVDDSFILPVYQINKVEVNKPVIIFGHANGFAAGSYLSFLKKLSQYALVFAFDARGHGGSQGTQLSQEYFKPYCLAKDLLYIVNFVKEKTNIEHIHFVGHSVNSSAALRLELHKSPPNWLSMTLFEPPVYPSMACVPGIEEAFERYFKLIKGTLKRRKYWLSRNEFIRSVSGRGGFSSMTSEQLKNHARATLRLNEEGVYELCCLPTSEASIYENLLEEKTWDQILKVKSNILLVSGDPSLPNPDWITLSMSILKNQLINSELKIISKSTHMMIFEEEDLCLNIALKQITQ